MENLSRDMAPKVARPANAKGQKREQEWTLMMVSDEGEVRTVHQRKGLRNLLIGALAVVLAASAVLFFLWRQAENETAALRQAVAVYKEHLSAMGVDQEDLATLLAVYRPSGRRAAPDDRGVREENPPPREAPPPAAPEPETTSPEEPVPESDEERAVASYEDVAPLVAPVGIEDFQTVIREGSGALAIRFKVTNIDPDVEKAEGHVILVLRPEAGGIGGGLALPPVTLVGGRPTGSEDGQAFSITNYKWVRFTADAETHPERFESATVFIFGEKGSLWMEEEFSITADTES